jgi:hypothetical protein
MKYNLILLLVLLTLMATATATLLAQSASPLHAAPGATAATENDRPAVTESAAETERNFSLLSNSDFASATSDPNWPDGWPRAEGIT